MSDVGHAYLPPAGEPTAIGTYATGETVCRWSQPAKPLTWCYARMDRAG